MNLGFDIDPSRLSLFQRVALLSKEERDEFFNSFTPEEIEKLPFDGELMLRPSQTPPDSPWDICLFSGGRGTGKTFAGAHFVKKFALANPGCRIGLIGRTSADVQRVMIYGDSGIMAVHHDSEKPVHKISRGRLEWPNGSIAETHSSEAPSSIRGPQYDMSWADEFASWLHTVDDSGLSAWDNVRMATRLGDHPKIFATTTPKRTAAVIDLFEEHMEKPESVIIMRGTTFDNAANLPESYLASVQGKYAGTSTYEQELLGELLTGENGALWTEELIEDYRWLSENPWRRLPVRCVAIDPSVAESPKDECGIVVVGATGQRNLHERHAYVLEDASVLGSPDVWAKRAIDMARKYSCPIVAEGTQGQALVANMLRSIDPSVKTFLVQTGSRGKKARAEPVILPYEQGRVHHVGHLEDLETQLTTWDPETSKKSPDRLDALVWGVTATLITPPKGFGNGPLRAKSASRRGQLPGGRGAGRTFRDGTNK